MVDRVLFIVRLLWTSLEGDRGGGGGGGWFHEA